MAAGLDAVAAGLEAVDLHALVLEERGEQADGVGAAADARRDGVREDAVLLEALGARLVADAAAEVADHARERVRPGRGAEEVGGVVDAGDPVAQRLVDRVLQRGAAGLDRDDLGAEELHAGDVERLAPGVDGSHVDGAVEVEPRGRGGAGDAVLAGTGLGDHPGLAHPLGQQGLAEDVADLVGPGVVEVLALEQHARTDEVGEPLGVVEPARACRRSRAAPARRWRRRTRRPSPRARRRSARPARRRGPRA